MAPDRGQLHIAGYECTNRSLTCNICDGCQSGAGRSRESSITHRVTLHRAHCFSSSCWLPVRASRSQTVQLEARGQGWWCAILSCGGGGESGAPTRDKAAISRSNCWITPKHSERELQMRCSCRCRQGEGKVQAYSNGRRCNALS